MTGKVQMIRFFTITLLISLATAISCSKHIDPQMIVGKILVVEYLGIQDKSIPRIIYYINGLKEK